METPEEATAVLNPVPPVPTLADGVEHPLDPRFVTVERIVGWIFTASLSLGLLVGLILVLVVTSVPMWVKVLLTAIWPVMTVLLAWHSHRWPEIEHRHARYTVDVRGIEIRRGVVWRKVINVPRSRVQHTDVSQGPLERRFGLGTLIVYTAGTHYAQVEVHGLDYGTALRIRDHLLPGDEDDVV